MSKSILLSIRPQWVAKILNGEKTIEVRKQFPKDYVGWVYIYCTKSKPYLWKGAYRPYHTVDTHNPFNYYWHCNPKYRSDFNGKVIARFWCDKVEEILNYGLARRSEIMMKDILEKSCLTMNELNEYAPHKEYKENDFIYAIHISELEIFDRPKYLTEYYKSYVETEKGIYYQVLTKAPQNYCYIEGEVKDGND